MLASEIISRVRNIFGDTQGALLTDPIMLQWINDAQMEIASQVDVLQQTSTAAAIAGTGDYTLPSNLNRIYTVKYKGQRLRQVSLEQAEELYPNKDDTSTYPTGTPQVFWTWGNTFSLYPAPATAGATDIKLFYYRNPTNVAVVGDTPELPTRLHPRIVEYCLAKAAELDDDTSRYATKISEFNSNVSQARGHEREVQYYPFITDFETEDFSPYYG